MFSDGRIQIFWWWFFLGGGRGACCFSFQNRITYIHYQSFCYLNRIMIFTVPNVYMNTSVRVLVSAPAILNKVCVCTFDRRTSVWQNCTIFNVLHRLSDK